MSYFYFSDSEVTVEMFPSVLVKSILKNGRDATEVKSEKKVVFADVVEDFV